MKTKILQQGGEVLRFREEDFGCVITDGHLIGEGNHMAYAVMCGLSERVDVSNIIGCLAEMFSKEPQEISQDVYEFIGHMQEHGWLKWVSIPRESA